MPGQLFILVTLTCLVMVTPGSDMMLVLRNTVLGGRRAGLRPPIRRWIARSQRAVNRVSGGLMILLGVRVAFSER